MYEYNRTWREATKGGNFRTGNPSYRARLIENMTSDVSLSFCKGVFAVRRSRSSSRSRSRYQDGGDCRDRPSIPCHRLRSASTVRRISLGDWLMRTGCWGGCSLLRVPLCKTNKGGKIIRAPGSDIWRPNHDKKIPRGN